jgi:hypothetical protein
VFLIYRGGKFAMTVMRDTLIEIEARRKKGQFYTPTSLAKHGWAYLEKELGKEFWLDGTWRIVG